MVIRSWHTPALATAKLPEVMRLLEDSLMTFPCYLSSRGIAVLVIDKSTGPASTSRALDLREILSLLGALGDLPARAAQVLSAGPARPRSAATR